MALSLSLLFCGRGMGAEANGRQGDRNAQGGASLVGDAAGKPQRPRSAPRASRLVLTGVGYPANSEWGGGGRPQLLSPTLLLSAWQGVEGMLFLRNHLGIHLMNIY